MNIINSTIQNIANYSDRQIKDLEARVEELIKEQQAAYRANKTDKEIAVMDARRQEAIMQINSDFESKKAQLIKDDDEYIESKVRADIQEQIDLVKQGVSLIRSGVNG